LGAEQLQRDWTRYGELEGLAATIYGSLQLHDTTHPVFHGAWDWHSAVHGHWALLRLSQLFGDLALRDELVERLGPPGIEQEFATLMDNPDFEMPYGRAWLLLLARDFEATCGRSHMRTPAGVVAESLLGWLESVDLHPDVGEYLNPCWVLLQLHEWFVDVGDDRGGEQIRRVVASQLQGQGLHPEQDFERPEFFSRWGLQALLIGRVLGGKALQRWVAAQALQPSALEPISTYLSVHHLGVNASRAWAFAELFRVGGESRWREAYERHLEASLALHRIHHADHPAYGHWVPQFIIYSWLAGNPPIPSGAPVG